MSGPTPEFPPVILRPADADGYDRGGGVRTIPLVRTANGAQVFLNGITVFAPEAALPLHVHNCAESVVILAGDAVVEIDGESTPLRPWDTTLVPAGIPHRFRNPSRTQQLRILWTYASIDATRTIVGSGVSTRVDAEGGAETGVPEGQSDAVPDGQSDG